MFAPIQISSAGSFYWKQPRKQKTAFELYRSRTEPVARISWDAGFRQTAIVQTEEGIFLLKRLHFPRPCITLQAEGKDEIIARVTFGWFGLAEFRQLEPKEFEWRCLDLWKARYGWVDMEGNEIVIFQPKTLEKRRIQIKFTEKAAALPQFGLLVVLGWYLVLNLAVNGIANPALAEGGS